MVLETSVLYRHLMWLIARGDFIESYIRAFSSFFIYPDSYPMGTGGSFPGDEAAGV